MTYKKRIMFVGEASFLNTGFSTYYRELLPRLVATGKYEIAELGSYARQDDTRVQEFIRGRWRFYGVMPTNEEEARAFQQPTPHPRTRGQNTNQFGEYKFAHAVADFKPDIVIDIRDWWMLEFQERNIFRPWYKWLVMPTVDAEPQQEEWIQTYENANMVLAYSDYGIHTLRRQSSLAHNGKRAMKIFPKPMRPGVDIDAFKPVDKKAIREHWNLAADVPIIGTVMRNQSRKLYPDLIDAFAMMKNKYRGEPQVDKAILLIHSNWPDNVFSYDYPRHIYRLERYDWMPNHKKGIRSDVMQSLYCYSCKQTSVTFAMNMWGRPTQEGRVKMPCNYCGKTEASPPSTNIGFNRDDLAKLYNLMDLYVQCSICFEPNTQVLTENGWRVISDIQEGQYIFGRDGELHKVYKTMQSESSNCVDLKLAGSPWITTLTDNHPCLVVQDQWPGDQRSLREKVAQKNPVDLEFVYKDAGDLTTDDLVVQRVPQHIIEPDMPFRVDEKMAWFIGLMVADGNANMANVSPYCRITCGQDDIVAFDRINNIAKRFDREAKIRQYKDRRAFDVSIYHKELCEQIHPMIYDNKIKKLPDQCLWWSSDLQLELIKGLVHGDGCEISEHVSGFFTTSPILARQVETILMRLGLYFNSHLQKRQAPRKNGYKFEINWTGLRSSSNTLYWKGFRFAKVKSVQASEYTGPVYNIDVQDDHNYVVNSCQLVHNCEGDGMPIQEAKACGVPTLVVDYTAMREKGRYPNYSHFEESGINEDNYTCYKGGDTINVGRYYYEPETSCKRALPDIADLALKMRNMINDQDHLKQLGREARECVETNYDWNKLWKQWEYVLDNIKILDRSETWDSPIAEIDEVKSVPTPLNLSDEQYVSWLYLNVLKYPSVDTDGAKMWVSHLQQGVTRDQLMQQFVAIGNQQSSASKMRDQVRLEVDGKLSAQPTKKMQEFV